MLLAQQIGPSFDVLDWTVPAVALAVFLGHLFPVFHGFAGGKGIATAAGIMLAMSWPRGSCFSLIWLVMAFGFKISSVAALTASFLAPIAAFYRFRQHARRVDLDCRSRCCSFGGIGPTSAGCFQEASVRSADDSRRQATVSDARSHRGATVNS